MTKESVVKTKTVGSNWNKLKTKVAANPNTKKKTVETTDQVDSTDPSNTAKLSAKVKSQYVGLDCEMVGIGPSGTQSALARCCLVDFDGEVIYDEFVRPPGFVTDFRTKWSGVRKKDLRQGTAISLQECQAAVANILKDKILVGHALKNDLDVLMLSHPRTMIRDTATYRPYMRIHGKHGKVRPRALKDLTKEHLKLEIQTGEHDPGVDARCAVMLYRKARDAWEQHLKDIRHAAKAKATASASDKAALLQQQQQAGNKQGGDVSASTSTTATTSSGGAGSGHSKASSAGKKRADCITEELRREIYGTTTTDGDGGSDGEGECDGERSEGEDDEAASELVVLRNAEGKSKSTTSSSGGNKKGKGPLSKADAVLSSVDIEVQVLDGSEGGDGDDGGDGGLGSTSISVKGKKRKLSKNGFISSNSSKHHTNEVNKLVSTKKARLSGVTSSTSNSVVPAVATTDGNDSAIKCGNSVSASASVSVSASDNVSGSHSKSKGKMNNHSSSRSIFSGSVDLAAAGLGGLGEKVRSIADVDRQMLKQQQKQKAAAAKGKK